MATHESRKNSEVIEAKLEAVALAMGAAASMFQPSPDDAVRPTVSPVEHERNDQREVQHQAAEVFASIEAARKRQREEEAEIASIYENRPRADMAAGDTQKMRVETEASSAPVAETASALDERATATERAQALVEETRRLEKVLEVMEQDGNTPEENENIKRQLSGRYQAIETSAAAREYRNRTGSAEERKRSLEAVRAAQVSKTLKV